jgi:hypothetical protein
MSESNSPLAPLLPTLTNDFLYHATFPDCEQTIRQAGIVPGIDNVVYLANKAEYAAGFIRIRNGFKMLGTIEVETPTGGTEMTYDISQTNTAIVCTILADLLDADALAVHQEEDEVSGFYPFDLVSFRYSRTVPPSAILSFDSFRLKRFDGESFL